MNTERDVMHYDLLIIGAGPAGLAAAIRFRQLAAAAGREFSVCVLEKGAQVGAQILSGAVIDPKGLDELLPEWRQMDAPLKTAVTREQLSWLTPTRKIPLPTKLLPPLMHNDGCYTGSLGELCQWLATQAEGLGVEIYPGFAAVAPLLDENGALAGVLTGDMGVDATGQPKAEYAPGIEIRAPYTLVAEGARGSLTGQLEPLFGLRDGGRFQKYGIGLKEVWQVPAEKHVPGLIEHTLGWPLSDRTGGGSFLYHYGDNLVAIGFVVHLDYDHPHLSPYQEFQRYKQHPQVRPVLEGGRRIAYGARAINEGGLQSLPDLVFPGGALIGCSAGFVNLPRIKGTHNAIKSGMLAAEAAFAALESPDLAPGRKLEAYPASLRNSWAWQDLDAVRNVKPRLAKYGTVLGSLVSGVEMWLGSLGLRLPWTLRHAKPDHAALRPAAEATPIAYPKPDNVVSFDRLASLALSNIAHDHDQPNHLQLKDAAVPITLNLPVYDAPEQRYCPAGVYEIVSTEGQPALQINAQNCIHCKTCDIKDPSQNIRWVPPEGGSGPIYNNM